MSEKKSKKIKQTRILICILVLIVVAIGVCVAFMLKNKGVLGSDNEVENTQSEASDKGYHEVTDENGLEDLQAAVKTSEEYVEPAEGTLDIEQIQGFTIGGAAVGETTDETASSESVEEESSESVDETIMLSDSNLTVEAIGSYSGNYLEDGSDEPIVNVAAMLITNNSDSMLQIAEITFQVNDTETASFKVTNLPAGTSTLVLEANKREYKEEDSYTYGNAATGYMEQPTLEEDKFELVTEKGKITLKNKTDESYDQVYVYYKYVQLGGAYLGGITYRTPFENVPAGGEAEAVAAHFNPDGSQIMAVQIVK